MSDRASINFDRLAAVYDESRVGSNEAGSTRGRSHRI